MLKAPLGEGVVYTIAPLDNVHKTRTVHRDLLKAQVTSASAAQKPKATVPTVSVTPSVDPSGEEDLWLMVRDPPPVSLVDANLCYRLATTGPQR